MEASVAFVPEHGGLGAKWRHRAQLAAEFVDAAKKAPGGKQALRRLESCVNPPPPRAMDPNMVEVWPYVEGAKKGTKLPRALPQK